MLRAAVAVCLLLSSAPNCSDLYSLAAHGFAVPAVNAASATAAADPRGMRLDVIFTANNPNAFPIVIEGVDYQLTSAGQPFFAGTQAGVTVPERGGASLQLTGLVTTSAPVYRSLRPGETVPYTIAGVARVQSPAGVRVDVEFESNGSFTVPQGLPSP